MRITLLDNGFSFTMQAGADGKREIKPEDRDKCQWLKTHHSIIGSEWYIASGFCGYGTKLLSMYMYDGIELYTLLRHARAFLRDERSIKAVIDRESGVEVTVAQEGLCDLYRYFYSMTEAISVCGKLTDNPRIAEKREHGQEYEYSERQLRAMSGATKALADRDMESARERAKSACDDALKNAVSSDVVLAASPDPVAVASKSIGGN